MTWADAGGPSTPSWGTETAATATWTAEADPQPTGNVSRFVDADGLVDDSGGVDFNNVFTTPNPFVFTTTAPIAFRPNREDPA